VRRRGVEEEEEAGDVGARVLQVRLLLTGGSGVAGTAPRRRRPGFSFSSSPFSPPAAGRRVGIRFPRAARVWRVPDAAAASSYSGGARGTRGRR
jgi:hypothetical protein